MLDEQDFWKTHDEGFAQALNEEANELNLELNDWHWIEEPPTSADCGSPALNITKALTQYSLQPIPSINLPPHGPILSSNTETHHSRHAESIPLPVSQQSSRQATTTDHSVITSESHSSSLSSESSNPHRSRNMEATEEDLYDRLRRLSAEAVNLRLKLDPLRTKQSELARDYDEAEQNTLKSLRVTYSQSSFEDGSKITIDREIFLEVIGHFSERRDEFGPLLEQMREYEFNLLRTEYQLRQVEEKLHNLYVEAKPQTAAAGQRYVMTGELGNEMSRRQSLFGPNRGEEAWDEESSEPDEFQEYDPSSLDPKFVEWQKQYVEMEHLQENLLYFARQEAKLRDQKQQRENTQLHISEHESVVLHLSPEDEQRLEMLTCKVLELEAQLKEGLELLAKLREECLEAGIDENEVPAVPVHTDEEDVEGEEEHEHADVTAVAAEPTDFKEWVITPAKDTKKRRWLRATARQQELSPEAVAKELKGLEASSSLKNATAALGRYQLQQVEAVRQKKNSTEPDERYEWVLAHLDRSSIRVFLKRVLKQDSQSAEAKQIAVRDEASQHEEYSSTVGGVISDTSGLPQTATYVDHSLVNSWLFTKLGQSIMDVRLLGTVLEIMGIPLLEETALMVMKYWNTDIEVSKDGRMASGVFGGWWERPEAFLKQEGYDHALAQQLEKAEWEPGIVERRDDESGGAESGYNSRGEVIKSK